jgi:histidinol-phosphate/aromatic aminotransferase/cobyric acid decarboxylase-like protein
MLPFSINVLSLAFARHMMFESDFREWAAACSDQIRKERDCMYRILTQNIPVDIATVYPSAGNFLLIRVRQDMSFSTLTQALEHAGIKVLNTSAMPLLKNTIRISIGSHAANNATVECVLDALSQMNVVVQDHAAVIAN